jgi:mono/diheme cytochrome c family protein
MAPDMTEEGGSDAPRQIRARSTVGSEGFWRRCIIGVLLAALAVAAIPLAVLRLREPEHKVAPKDRVEAEIKVGRLPSRGGETQSGGELYATHCAVCHGATGNGFGHAARYLFPRPRDFGASGLQMASTRNGVASLEDVKKVLILGMAGTSMQAFDTLSPSERRLLAQEILRLRREGAHQQMARAMREAGEEPVEAEVRDAVEHTTTPGRPIPLPDRWPRSDQAGARGAVAYRTLGCDKCHGDDGAGAADQPLFDAQGEPNRARDLVHEPFKGGRERESIYLRIAVGMPGTAHPAVPGLSQEQLTDLVEYVLSLARQPYCVLTNYDRRVRADARAYRERLGR